MMSFGRLMRCCLKRHRSFALGSYSLARAIERKALEHSTGARFAILRSLAFGLEARTLSRGDRLIGLEALVTGTGGLANGRRTEIVVLGEAK